MPDIDDERNPVHISIAIGSNWSAFEDLINRHGGQGWPVT